MPKVIRRLDLGYFMLGNTFGLIVSLSGVLISDRSGLGVISGLLGFYVGISFFAIVVKSLRDKVGDKPPISGQFLLYIMLAREDRDTIPGDLYEEYTTIILPKFGGLRAWLWYWFQIVRTIAYRNVMFRWLLIGGGIFKIADWITRKIGG